MDSETLTAVSGVRFSEEARTELIERTKWCATQVGSKDVRPRAVLNRLAVIRNSASKILKHSAGDGLEAQMIRNELVSDELREELDWLTDAVEKFEAGFERFAQAEPNHRPRDSFLDALVTDTMTLWKAAGGNGRGAYKSELSDSGYDGPLLRLVRALLMFGGCENFPSDAKIHDTILHVEKNPYQGVTLKKR